MTQKQKYTSRNPLFFLILYMIGGGGLLWGCAPADEDSAAEKTIQDFPNVLNYKGIPAHPTDRSVFMFSDLGAWHGYALPDTTHRNFWGSFVGPFLMTQDNGVWISPALMHLELIDQASGNTISFNDATLENTAAYPGRLQQVFTLPTAQIRLTATLIFVTSRTALTHLQLEPLGANPDQVLTLRWQVSSFLDGVTFSPEDAGLRIHFGKNDHIGQIQFDPRETVQMAMQDSTYVLNISNLSLTSGVTRDIYFAQTFCFSDTEWQREKMHQARVFEHPTDFLMQNHATWDERLQRVLSKINHTYEDKSYQNVAIKSVTTLVNNWRSKAGFFKHEGLFPSYNYEWFNGFWSWDSWKHAVALAYVHPTLAQNQIRTMYDFQDEMGMIADCVYRDTLIENHNWRNTKPPLSAWAIWEVFTQTQDTTFLAELFPKVERYHQWWYQYRDHDQNGLCEYGSTDGTLIAAKWESGMDNAVRFDEAELVQNNAHAWSMNRESVDLNAYLFAEKQYLAQIADILSDSQSVNQYRREAEALKVRIQTDFFDETDGWFYDIDLHTKAHLKTQGPEGWIPLWTGVATPAQAARVQAIMRDTTRFATYIPLPTLAANHPKFKPQNGYWRGPIWLDQVYFGIKGLERYGYDTLAQHFTHQLFDHLEGLKDADLPIRENYHPLTGAGLESNHFSWSAAHILLLLMGK